MRIATSALQRSVVQAVQSNLQRIARAQAQIATEKRIQTVSDDPVAASEVMADNEELRATDQYRRNLSTVSTRADLEESVLSQLTLLIERAQELATAQSSGTATTATRLVAKAEVDRIIEQVAQLGNTKLGREYIFGGFQTATAPFAATTASPAIASATISGERSLEVGRGQFTLANNNGQTVFVASGVVAGLTALRDGLMAGGGDAVGAAIPVLGASFDKVQSLIGDVGGRMNQLESVGGSLDALEMSVTIHKSVREGVDLSTSTTELLAAQTSLQAALLSASRVLNISLAQYLT
jgi:flagellar hook-associated protein 3 FlgL